jgi:hypothetical protein
MFYPVDCFSCSLYLMSSMFSSLLSFTYVATVHFLRLKWAHDSSCSDLTDLCFRFMSFCSGYSFEFVFCPICFWFYPSTHFFRLGSCRSPPTSVHHDSNSLDSMRLSSFCGMSFDLFFIVSHFLFFPLLFHLFHFASSVCETDDLTFSVQLDPPHTLFIRIALTNRHCSYCSPLARVFNRLVHLTSLQIPHLCTLTTLTSHARRFSPRPLSSLAPDAFYTISPLLYLPLC